MEEAVPQGVRFQSGDGLRRIVAVVGEHVVPLQDLVEHDPVHESA